VRRCRRFFFAFVLLIAGLAAVLVVRDRSVERRYTLQIRAAAERYRIDPLLVRAVVWRESRFNPAARGGAGEIGLMQIQEEAAREWAEAEGVRPFVHELCLDPGTNTMAGAFYLGKLLKRYSRSDNPLPYALADYNAGRGNVLNWNNGAAATNSAIFVAQIGFPGTRLYVNSVMRRRELYKVLSRLGWF